MRKGERMSEEQKAVISRANTGRKFSDEFKKNMSERMKKQTPWNKGISKFEHERDKYFAYYGITFEEYNRFLEVQNHSCRICGKHQRNLKNALHVDHDHETGKVRGLLCRNCNLGIGHLKDNLELISNALKYFLDHKQATKEKVIVFGLNDYSQLAHFYFTRDSDYEVVAFCVTPEFKTMQEFLDLPVVTTEEVLAMFPPSEFNMFIPMSPKLMNENRQKMYQLMKMAGYKFINYISSKATVLTEDIGENNFILENNVIQPFVKLGDNNVLWSGNHIGHHSVIGNHNTFTSHVVLSGHCTVKDNCFFGVNSTIRDGLNIERYSLISQGANVLKSTEEGGIYMGNPAKKLEGKHSFEMI